MNGLPYYKAYPRDFIEGTIGMDLETKGAYRLILDLIYMRNGRLADDARYIAGQLGCAVKKWNIIRAKLLYLSALYIQEGHLLSNYYSAWLEQSRKIEIRPAIPVGVRKEVMERDGPLCAYCLDTQGPFHLDHVFPWSKGGPHSIENLTVACAACNLSKRDKTVKEWMGQ